MDKQVVLAVAGSGKTSSLIDRVCRNDRALFVTFTNANEANIIERIVSKFGEIPLGFRVCTYFSFLYRFCFSPFLDDEMALKGVTWDMPPNYTLRLKRSDPRFFISPGNRLYGNRLAKLVIDRVIDEVRNRLEKFFDILLVDEVQDFGGHDFDLLIKLSESNLRIICAGDYFQHTYDTSRDGNVNATLHNCYANFQSRLAAGGFDIDCASLDRSYRCSPAVCKFISNSLGISIDSHRTDSTVVEIVSSKQKLTAIRADKRIVKLFFKEHYKNGCYSGNWGESKGEDCYSDVCVILTKKASELLVKDKLSTLPSSSRNKLYVAASRARGNLYIVPHNLYDSTG